MNSLPDCEKASFPQHRLSLAEQDKIDAKLLKCTQAGVGQRGQLLKRIMNGTDSVGVKSAGSK